jgi:regulator of CtrA degradation
MGDMVNRAPLDSPSSFGEGRGRRAQRARDGVSQTAQATSFFGKTYGEAMGLLEESRDYLTHREPIDRERLVSLDRLRLCCETMRLTARLTQIMAWLLAQRAVHAGEITQQVALGDNCALAELAVCMGGAEAESDVLPRHLVALLARSRRLYVRVARLDELARRQPA